MALSAFQRDTCQLVARNRLQNGESYLAGAAALNELLRAPRLSRDLDIFHDTEEAVSVSWQADRTLFDEAGYEVLALRERQGFVAAEVRRGGDTVLMQWASNTAERQPRRSMGASAALRLPGLIGCGSSQSHGARFVIGPLMTTYESETGVRQLRRLWLAAACGVLLCAGLVYANQVAVLHVQGTLHAFLALRSMDGKTLAHGELIQTVDGGQVTARLVFRFRDGSLHDETAVFTQKEQIRLVSDRVVQRGPSFPRPLEMSIDASSGRVTVEYTTDEGEKKQKAETMDLPADLANGIIVTLLTNVTPESHPESVSFLAATPDPRLVRLKITPAGTDRFTTGGQTRSAIHYVLKVDIGGLSGLLAGLVGKQPPDSHVWIAGGKAPAFIRADEPLYAGGPLWRIDIVAPEWKLPPAAR